MYCAYDDEKNIIAFHDNKKIVKRYTDNVHSVHKITLNIGKIKKDSKWKLRNKDELYLVRYNDTYVQSGYLLYLQLSSTQYIEDEEFARDILFRLLETERLTPKQKKKLEKAIEVMEDIIEEDRNFVPTLSELKTMKGDYDPYVYNTGLFDI